MAGEGLPSDAQSAAKGKTSPTTTSLPNALATGTVGEFNPGSPLGGAAGDWSTPEGRASATTPALLFERWLADSLAPDFSQPIGQDAMGQDVTAGDSQRMAGLGGAGSISDLLMRIQSMTEAQVSYLQRRLFQAGFYSSGVYKNSSSISWGIIDNATMQAIQSAVTVAGVNQVEDFDQFLENERVRFGREGTNAAGDDVEGALTARREVNVTLDDPDTLKLIAERAGTTLLGRHPTETEMSKLMEAVWSERRAAARTPSAEDKMLDEASQDTGALLQDLEDLPGGYDPNADMARLDAEQTAVANTIIQVGHQMGLPEEMIVAAISAGMVESGLRNLNHGDRDSLGVFQQRPSQGWGTPQQVRDVAYASRKFYEAMLRTERKGDLGTWVADTQRPAKQYRGRYGEAMNRAANAYLQVTQSAGLVNNKIPSMDDLGAWQAQQRTEQNQGGGAWGGGFHRGIRNAALNPTPQHEIITHEDTPYWGESLLADSARDAIYSEQFAVDPEATIENQLRAMDPTAYDTKQIANRAYEFFALLQAGGMANG